MRRMRLLGCVLVLVAVWAWAGCSGGGDADKAPAKEAATPAVHEADTTAAVPAAAPAPDSTTAAGSASEPAAESAAPPQETAPEPAAETPPAATTPAPVPAGETPAESAPPAETPASGEPAASTPAAEPPAAEAPAPAAPDLTGKAVAVPPTKEGLSYVGAAKCKICHKIQYASWEQSAHAKRTPPLECEGCHGPGSEYKSLKIMKDLEAAKAAGLVIPDKSFCVQCHREDWKDDMLARAHAHKE